MTDEELLRAIYADPESDEPRLVYADWLLERGDPRGEFIALQYARRDRPLTPAEAARERALLEEHRRRWLGPLHQTVSRERERFERGFLEACLAHGVWEEFARAPEWSTVRELDFVPFARVDLRAEALRALRVLRGVEHLRVLADAGGPLGIEELAWSGPSIGPDGVPHHSDVVGWWALGGLPALRRLWLWGDATWTERARPPSFAWLREGPAGAGLDWLGLTTAFDALDAWLAFAREQRLGGMRLVAHRRREPEGPGWRLDFALEPDGAARLEAIETGAEPTSARDLRAITRGIERLPTDAVTALVVRSAAPLGPDARRLVDQAAARQSRLDVLEMVS